MTPAQKAQKGMLLETLKRQLATAENSSLPDENYISSLRERIKALTVELIQAPIGADEVANKRLVKK